MAPAPPWIRTPRVAWLIKPDVGVQLPYVDKSSHWTHFWSCGPGIHSLKSHPFYRISGYYPESDNSHFAIGPLETYSREIWRYCVKKCLDQYHGDKLDFEGPLGQEIVEELCAPQQFEHLAISFHVYTFMRVEEGHTFSNQGEFRARSFLRMIGAISEEHGNFVVMQAVQRLVQNSVRMLVEKRLSESPEYCHRRGRLDWSEIGETGEVNIEDPDIPSDTVLNSPAAHQRGRFRSAWAAELAERTIQDIEDLTLDPGPGNVLHGDANDRSGSNLNNSPGAEPEAMSGAGSPSEPGQEPASVSGAGADGVDEAGASAQDNNTPDSMGTDSGNEGTIDLERPQEPDPEHEVAPRARASARAWNDLRNFQFSQDRRTVDDTRIPFPGIFLSSSLVRYDHSISWSDQTQFFTPTSRPHFTDFRALMPHLDALRDHIGRAYAQAHTGQRNIAVASNIATQTTSVTGSVDAQAIDTQTVDAGTQTDEVPNTASQTQQIAATQAETADQPEEPIPRLQLDDYWTM
ncbi:hypothetical protein TWF718_007906 [Orbilia javanica]|uniref:Uncharacterized protein n=1 Tax=Orbilia javanica TaxID=47235 RepID=A0AAN8NTB5_9PEZI